AQPVQGVPVTFAGDDPVLDVRNMTVRFPVHKGLLHRLTGMVHAVEQVSFAIGKGETLGLVGESGSGKSTIGKAVIKLAALHDGEVRVSGKPVNYTDPTSLANMRRDVQMIFQDPFGS